MDEEILKLLEEKLSKSREYAIYWEWPDRPKRDCGIVSDFLHSLYRTDMPPFKPRTLRSRGNDDPPDCEIEDLQGRQIGFEVTELVSREGIKLLKSRGLYYPQEWSPSQVVNAISGVLRRKERERSKLKGGPYHKLVLLIHTDEPGLRAESCKSALAKESFPKPTPWDEVYIVFPPEPGDVDEGNPIIDLTPLLK
jgi:hypothetical protein